MVAWSIEAAQASNLFDRIIVSTDDAEISEVAQAYGAEVPFIRPRELSNDYVGTTPVVAHATQWAIEQCDDLEAVCCIYPTAPFICFDDLKRGLLDLRSGEWAYAFAVTEFDAPIFRSFEKTSTGGVRMFFPEHYSTRSQDLPVALHDAGQFYWGLPHAWLENRPVFDQHSIPVVIPRWRVQDIDTLADWERAEMIFPTVAVHSSRDS